MQILDPNKKPRGKQFLSINDKGCFRLTRNFIREEDPNPAERAAIAWDEDGYYLLLIRPGDRDYHLGLALNWGRSGLELKFYSKTLAEQIIGKGGELQSYRLGVVQKDSENRRLYPILGVRPPVTVAERPEVPENGALYQAESGNLVY